MKNWIWLGVFLGCYTSVYAQKTLILGEQDQDVEGIVKQVERVSGSFTLVEKELFLYPAWVLYERGLQFYRAQEFDKALTYLYTAFRRKGMFPEAHYYLSLIYYQLGRVDLSKQSALRALTQKEFLGAESFYYKILYQLAFLARQVEDYEQERQYLYQILVVDVSYAEIRQSLDANRFLPAFLDRQQEKEGLDWLFFLYHSEYTFSSSAYIQLGDLHRKMWDYRRAFDFYAQAFNEILGTLYHMVSDLNPFYEFTTVKNLIELSSHYRSLQYFMEEVNISLLLYNLGKTVYWLAPEQNYFKAVDVWRLSIELDLDNDVVRWAQQSILSPAQRGVPLVLSEPLAVLSN